VPYYTIPVTNEPDQNFICTVPVNGQNITLRFRLRYNTQGGYWWLTLADKNGNVLVDGVPLLTGQNILEQYQYLNIGSAYVVKTGSSPLDSPDEQSLGKDFLLVWGD
jgi:hypothetical protein